MTPETMPEPEGPEDERFVYVVTAAEVEALRRERRRRSTASGRRAAALPARTTAHLETGPIAPATRPAS